MALYLLDGTFGIRWNIPPAAAEEDARLVILDGFGSSE